ncbi:hypothetical protein D5S18_18965 [Nocardia panacis]|uniref:Uncharacterized protein n=1 Tax=Nocardia panacis TaxID=2340916 RepID=A0A3A4K765_9NOCA|nr:hypothetical protein [Nocardia panacis]RJO73332.1 hypothetical protein D5S18_18965 [Nocardia panacis]
MDPDELDRAAKVMRKMAVLDFHIGDDLKRGLTERAGADRIFGNSPAANNISAKWDQIITTLSRDVEDLGAKTQNMAENLERAADMYRSKEGQSADRFWRTI